jgi:restriction system protein
MARKRGLLAELAHQKAVAQRGRERAEAVAVREHNRLVREAERAHRAAESAEARYQRASAAAARDMERESKIAHLEARQAEVELMNADLAVQIEDIDNLLTATLGVDDYVDLEQLRVTAKHPPFVSENAAPLPQPVLPQPPAQPLYQEPVPPKGLFGKKKHQEAVRAAQADYQVAMAQWNEFAASIPAQQLAIMNDYQSAEQARLQRLQADNAAYEAASAERQRDADEANARLDQLIADLAERNAKAVEEYLTIVFSNTVYPDYFPGVTDIRYEPLSGEVSLKYEFPRPEQLPTVRQYKYTKASDEITSTNQTQKDQRDRYNGMVAAMTLRCLHEAWESDRAGHLRTISFTGVVSHIDSATGAEKDTTLVQLAAEREQFLSIDLSRVTPAETLAYLNANVSKNPHGLVAIPGGAGIRGH